MSRVEVSRVEVSRHERDEVSLMAGLLLVLVAGGFLLADLTSVSIQARWVCPAVLLVVGAVGLLASLRPTRSASEPLDDPEPLDAPAP